MNEEEKGYELEFYKYMPDDACLFVYIFLDPYSAFRLASTCRKLQRVYRSQAFSEYFKILCINLFEKYQPRMPDPCRFLQVRSYALKNAQTLGPNIQHAVVTNLRKYVWQEVIKIEREPAGYYVSFGGYRELYFNLPRINFNGYYLCKHEYRKEE